MRYDKYNLKTCYDIHYTGSHHCIIGTGAMRMETAATNTATAAANCMTRASQRQICTPIAYNAVYVFNSELTYSITKPRHIFLFPAGSGAASTDDNLIHWQRAAVTATERFRH